MAAAVTDDIRELVALIGQLVDQCKKTTEAGSVVNLDTQQPPYQRIEDLLLEKVKLILRKYYVQADEQPAPSCSTSTTPRSPGTEQWPSPATAFLLSVIDAQISALKTTQHNGQLLRGYVLVGALTHAVVGLQKLLSVASHSAAANDSESCNQEESAESQPPPPPILSTSQALLIRRAIIHTWSVAFSSPLQRHFSKPHSVFYLDESTSDRVVVKAEDGDDGELFRLKPIYLLYVSLLLHTATASIILESIRRDVYSPLIAAFALYRGHNLLKTTPVASCLGGHQLVVVETALRKQFEEYIAERANQPYVIRSLFYLISVRCAPKPFALRCLMNVVQKYITQPHGLEIVLHSTLDSDQTSERETTIIKRLDGIALMISGLSKLTKYQQNVLQQAVGSLLVKTTVEQDHIGAPKHALDIYWRLGALILRNIEAENATLVKSVVFGELQQVLAGERGTLVPSIEVAVLLIHRLFLTRICIEYLVPLVAPLFYIRLALDSSALTAVPSTELLDETLVEALREIPESAYVLDDAIFEKIEHWMDRFEAQVDCSGPELVQRIRRRPKEMMTAEQLVERSKTVAKSLAKVTMSLLVKMNCHSYEFNFLFILLDRMMAPLESFSVPQVLVLAELTPLGLQQLGATISKAEEEQREARLFSDYRTMRTLAMIFQRIVEQLTKEPTMRPNLEDADLDFDRLQQWSNCLRSLKFCVGALALFVMNEKTVLKTEDGELATQIRPHVKSCYVTLSRLLKYAHFKQLCTDVDKVPQFFPEEGDHVDDLKGKHKEPEGMMEFSAGFVHTALEELLEKTQEESSVDEEDELARCLRDLHHPLVPVQAHGLITVKQLVYQRNKVLEEPEKRQQLLDELKLCLENGDSYIYLAAINALAALAVRYTDQVMPIMLEQFIFATRPLPDRLKTGEVLRQLAKSIGDYAYHYSEMFISKLLLGVNASEAEMRMSALSCLGEYCAAIRHGLGKHIVELTSMVAGLAVDSTATLEVKRAAVLFLRMLLQGVDGSGAMLLAEHMTALYRTLKLFGNVLDDVLQLHVQLANEELQRICGELVAVKGGGYELTEKKLVQLIED